MNFLKSIFINALKGVLSFFLTFIFIIFFFSIIYSLLSENTEKEIIVEPNSLLLIDNLSIIGDRDTKPSELNFNFNELPLPIPIIDNSEIQQKIR